MGSPPGSRSRGPAPSWAGSGPWPYSRPVDWRLAGTYLEACNCDAICPCRTIGGVPGGRSTHGICLGVLSWFVEEGHADDVDLSKTAVALVCRDNEPGWLLRNRV